MISLVIYGSRDAFPTVEEIDRGVLQLGGMPSTVRVGPLDEVVARVIPHITEVLCGMASGADLCGKAWSEARGIPVHEMPADWERWPYSDPIHSRRGKLKDPRAGYKRNRRMAERATHGLGYWYRESGGTANMACWMSALGKGAQNRVVEWSPR